MIEDKYFSSNPMPTQRVTSRRAKTESKKMFRQTLLMLFSSIVIILVFLFLVLPNLLKFISGQGGDTNFTGNEIPPQIPTISTPVTATNSAELSINGYSEKNTIVYLILNGQEFNKITVDNDDGQFEIPLTLEEGENTLKFFAENEKQNQSDTTREFTILFDQTVPTLELETPTDQQLIELRKNQLTTIKGKTEANARVEINGRLTKADAEGNFSTTFQLQEGDNLIKFIVSDEAGNKIEQEITVKFKL